MASDQRLIIEPLDTTRHDRNSFSSGVKQCDNFLRLTAGKLGKAGHVRTFVLTQNGEDIIGYYALNAHSIDYMDLPTRFARDRPASGSVPAAFIAMIAVDQREQGKGYGGDLLTDALKRIAKASQSIGISVAVLDILDDGDITAVDRRLTLYKSYGFQPFANRPLRLWISVRGL
ncbi:MAG: GNAT family N-acetyltransferase [Rhizobiaceae bacterium]